MAANSNEEAVNDCTPSFAVPPGRESARRKIEEKIREVVEKISEGRMDLDDATKALANLERARQALQTPLNPSEPDSDGLLARLMERACWDPCDPCCEPPKIAKVTGYALLLSKQYCVPKCPPNTCHRGSGCGCHDKGKEEHYASLKSRFADKWWRVYSDLSLTKWIDVWEGQIVWLEKEGSPQSGRPRYTMWVIRPECLIVQESRTIEGSTYF